MSNKEIIFRKRKYKRSPDGVAVFVGIYVGIKDRTTTIAKPMNKVDRNIQTFMTELMLDVLHQREKFSYQMEVFKRHTLRQL